MGAELDAGGCGRRRRRGIRPLDERVFDVVRAPARSPAPETVPPPAGVAGTRRVLGALLLPRLLGLRGGVPRSLGLRGGVSRSLGLRGGVSRQRNGVRHTPVILARPRQPVCGAGKSTQHGPFLVETGDGLGAILAGPLREGFRSPSSLASLRPPPCSCRRRRRPS
jgi:hypothetical protein